MSFEVIVFCKVSALHNYCKTVKFTFKLTFVSTNQINNKNQSFSVTLRLNPICFETTDIQFIKTTACRETASSKTPHSLRGVL